MLEHLLESNVTFAPRVGSSAVSTVVHAILVSAAIALSATTHHAVAEPVESHLLYVAPKVETIDTTLPADMARRKMTDALRSFLSATDLNSLTLPYRHS